MIGKAGKRGETAYGLLRYLFGPGVSNEHVNPRLVASWRGDPARLEPQAREDGKRDVTRLATLMEVGLDLAYGKIPDKPAYHVAVRAADVDRDLTDAEWQDISTEVMDRLGLSERGKEEDGCPWVAVHHGDNHIHLAVVLARLDGRPVRLHGDFYRLGDAMTWAEKKYGLAVVPRGSQRRGDTRVGPTRAETGKAERLGLAEPPRVTLCRHVDEAAAQVRSEGEFFTILEDRGILLHLHRPPGSVTEVDGYAVGLPGDTGSSGQVYFSGRQLGSSLSLPRLRQRWAGVQPEDAGAVGDVGDNG